jgi:CheY-like chemotaxis protein
MGGEIDERSEPGRGSCFTFEVALPQGTAPPSASRRAVGPARGEMQRRILLVDDVDDNRAVLARLLAPMGFELREARDGREALSFVSSWRPDLVFLDWRMPVMGGNKLSRRIRSAEKAESDSPFTRIVALTASAFEHDREAILAAGCEPS